MSNSKNLWSKRIGQETVKAPKTFMVEQANYFNEMTKNKLVAKVESYQRKRGEKNYLVHEFDITSPTLGNYNFTLFYIEHDISMFPLTLRFSLVDHNPISVNSQSNFEESLEGLMNHKDTINAINGLLAQA